MPCPAGYSTHGGTRCCGSSRTREQPKQASLGYRTFRCAGCRRCCNERTGTQFNASRARVPGVPADVAFLVVR